MRHNGSWQDSLQQLAPVGEATPMLRTWYDAVHQCAPVEWFQSTRSWLDAAVLKSLSSLQQRSPFRAAQ